MVGGQLPSSLFVLVECCLVGKQLLAELAFRLPGRCIVLLLSVEDRQLVFAKDLEPLIVKTVPDSVHPLFGPCFAETVAWAGLVWAKPGRERTPATERVRSTRLVKPAICICILHSSTSQTESGRHTGCSTHGEGKEWKT